MFYRLICNPVRFVSKVQVDHINHLETQYSVLGISRIFYCTCQISVSSGTWPYIVHFIRSRLCHRRVPGLLLQDLSGLGSSSFMTPCWRHIP